MAANDFGVNQDMKRYTTIMTKWGERAFNCFVGAILFGGILAGALVTLFVPSPLVFIQALAFVEIVAVLGYFICNEIDSKKGGGCVEN